MNIMLDIDGWRKVQDVDAWMVNRGYVTVGIEYPLSVYARDSDTTEIGRSAAPVTLEYTGERTARGMPIFKYRP